MKVLRLIAATLQFNKMSPEEGFSEFDSDADGYVYPPVSPTLNPGSLLYVRCHLCPLTATLILMLHALYWAIYTHYPSPFASLFLLLYTLQPLRSTLRFLPPAPYTVCHKPYTIPTLLLTLTTQS
jgi:hypothetical protein